MKTFIIENENLPNMFLELDSLLNMIEVKGESVSHMFKTRTILKDIFSQIRESEKSNSHDEVVKSD